MVMIQDWEHKIEWSVLKSKIGEVTIKSRSGKRWRHKERKKEKNCVDLRCLRCYRSNMCLSLFQSDCQMLGALKIVNGSHQQWSQVAARDGCMVQSSAREVRQ